MGLSGTIDIGRMDELGRMDSPVHRLDARAKILATLAFVLVVMSFDRYQISALMALFVFPVALIAAGNLPAGYLLKKIACVAPFAICVGILNPFLDREPMGMLGNWAVAAGWYSFGSILVRFLLTVSAALVLVCTTGIHQICEGLERMGMPPVFVGQLLFLYRYFFVIAEEAGRMMRSVELRSGERRLELGTYATLIGHLLLRSIDRAQRIYRAMVSRGFQGEIRSMTMRQPRGVDALWLSGWCGFFCIARYWNLAAEVGRHL